MQTLDEILSFRRNPTGHDCLILFSLGKCIPCDLLNQVLPMMSIGKPIYSCKIAIDNKRALGKALLAGVCNFPRLEVYETGRLVTAFDGLAATTVEEAIEELRNKLPLRLSKQTTII